MGKDAPETFAELIDKAQKAPDPLAAPSAPLPFANPFQMPEFKERTVDTADEPLRIDSPRLIHAHHSNVFNLGDGGDRQAYDALHTRIANSPPLEKAFKENPTLTLRRDENHVTKDGDWLALIQYVESYPDRTRRAKPSRDEEQDDYEEMPQ